MSRRERWRTGRLHARSFFKMATLISDHWPSGYPPPLPRSLPKDAQADAYRIFKEEVESLLFLNKHPMIYDG